MTKITYTSSDVDLGAFHAAFDGVVFTGSKTVGLRIYHGLSTRWIKPYLMELGGKASGSTGEGGCGPCYVAQFMREQSHTVIGRGS